MAKDPTVNRPMKLATCPMVVGTSSPRAEEDEEADAAAAITVDHVHGHNNNIVPTGLSNRANFAYG